MYARCRPFANCHRNDERTVSIANAQIFSNINLNQSETIGINPMADLSVSVGRARSVPFYAFISIECWTDSFVPFYLFSGWSSQHVIRVFHCVRGIISAWYSGNAMCKIIDAIKIRKKNNGDQKVYIRARRKKMIEKVASRAWNILFELWREYYSTE